MPHRTDPKLQWKILSKEYISREPWFTVRKECVELPNGNRIPNIYVHEFPDWINVIALTKDGKMILVQQYRAGLDRVFFEIPAGVSEKTDKTMLDAAKRELLEETGYGNGKWTEFDTLSANPAMYSNRTHTFLAEGVEKIAGLDLDQGEALTVHLLDPAEVLDMLKNGEIMQALMSSVLWKYFYFRAHAQR